MSKSIDPNQLPPEVREAFAKRFPGVENGEWEIEAQYEVEFEENGREVEVNFHPDGSIEQIEYEMDVEDLPTTVKNAIQKEYPHCEAEEAERVEKGDGTILYEVSLTFQVHMTPDGKIAAIGKDL